MLIPLVATLSGATANPESMGPIGTFLVEYLPLHPLLPAVIAIFILALFYSKYRKISPYVIYASLNLRSWVIFIYLLLSGVLSPLHPECLNIINCSNKNTGVLYNLKGLFWGAAANVLWVSMWLPEVIFGTTIFIYGAIGLSKDFSSKKITGISPWCILIILLTLFLWGVSYNGILNQEDD